MWEIKKVCRKYIIAATRGEKTMTGAYLRVKRGGKFKTIEVEHLTKEERSALFYDAPHETLLNWIDMLCENIVETQSLLDELLEEGLLCRQTYLQFLQT